MTSPLRRRQQQQRRYPGLYRALVVNPTDPQQTHRVQVSLPWLSGSTTSWAATLRQPGVGLQIGDEVVVGFDAGRLSQPYVVGLLTSAQPTVIELSDDNGNTVRLSTSGVDITASAEVRVSASKI